jgi:hypothetical protein
MLPKFAIAGLAATAFVAATALTPTGAAAGGRGGGAGNYPHYGSWNWPAYTEMNCGYVRVNGYRQKQPGNGSISAVRPPRNVAVTPRRASAPG